MFKRTILIVPLFLIFVLTNCVEVDMKLKVNKDGSGTIEEKIVASEALVSMLSSFMEMGDSTSSEGFDLLDEEKLKSDALKMGEGVRLVKAEKIDDGRKQGYIAYYEFDDITKIKVDDDPEDKVPSDMTEEGEGSNEDMNYITFQFTKGDPSKLVINLPEKDESDIEFGSEETTEDSVDTNEWGEQLKQILKELKFSVKVEVNGDITETNATYVDGSQITIFEMDFGQILENPEKFNEFKSKKPDNFDEMRELLKETPGFKVEFEEKVEIKFN